MYRSAKESPRDAIKLQNPSNAELVPIPRTQGQSAPGPPGMRQTFVDRCLTRLHNLQGDLACGTARRPNSSTLGRIRGLQLCMEAAGYVFNSTAMVGDLATRTNFSHAGFTEPNLQQMYGLTRKKAKKRLRAAVKDERYASTRPLSNLLLICAYSVDMQDAKNDEDRTRSMDRSDSTSGTVHASPQG